MDVHRKTCLDKEEETVLTRDLKLPNCFVWIPMLQIPRKSVWNEKSKKNADKYQQVPENTPEVADELEAQGWQLWFFTYSFRLMG